MQNPVDRWRQQLRGTFSNNSPTIPQWERDLEKGNDAGYFGPASAAWAVHGSMTTLVAGIQALLIQALHPGALAGIYDHSNYRTDPLGRLAGTIQWIFTITYGDTATAQQAAAKVQRIHGHVRGSYTANSGEERPYSANDPELLRWVHLAFTQAFLSSHLAYGGPIPGGPNAYVADWAVAGALMHVTDPPTSVEELNTQLDAFTGELRCDERAREAIAFIRHPPLPRSQRAGYMVLFSAAVAALPPVYRELMQLNVPALGRVPLPVRVPTQIVLAVVRWSLGSPSPSEAAARVRRLRLGMQDAPSKRR